MCERAREISKHCANYFRVTQKNILIYELKMHFRCYVNAILFKCLRLKNKKMLYSYCSTQRILPDNHE